jgi:hypothetical protein
MNCASPQISAQSSDEEILSSRRQITMLKARFTLTIAVIVAVMFLMPLAVHAVTIVEGFDFWNTTEAEVEILGVGMVPLKGLPFPPDNPFFPLPPIPIIGGALFLNLDRHGNEVGPDSRHKVSQILRPDVTPFDTIVRRKAGVDISGVGSEADVPIEIVWLSLMSVNPIDIGFGLVDVYVGLTPGSQITGRMRLKSDVAEGTAGTVNLGAIGDPIDTPPHDFSLDLNALGLPVTYDVIFTHHSTLNIAHRENGLQSVFHTQGTYAIPEPSSLLLLAAGLVGIIVFGRKRLSKKA